VVSFAQERLWFINELVPNNAGYNMPMAIWLKGRLDIGALERAVNEMERRHEVLRTTFESREGKPVQVIREASRRELEVVDLSGRSEEERGVEARGLVQQEAQEAFDLRRGPLTRMKVMKLGAEEHVILYTMHHIISDGWSLGVVGRELSALYSGYAAGKESVLEELVVQYGDYAQWQRQWLSGEVLEEQLRYWKEQLEGLEVLRLPVDRVRPLMQSFEGKERWLKFKGETVERLRQLSQEAGVTLFMTLLAGFKILLKRYSDQEDVAVGMAIANRNRAEIEGLIGFFVNTLVLRTDMGGDPRVKELVGRVKGVTLEAYDHQDLPFEKLVEELQPERDLSRNPLVQVMVQYLNAPLGGTEVEGLKVQSGGGEIRTTRFDV